ncbi:MAG TPA: SDR family NAD(P)-dependent oxidoreductase [Rhizomicrobium sp.]|jgi:CDP-paratose 2-epimerase|nr:SDR family NAD(P)-dependent oxidoreductase [Rhizomicrobium sp.]
MNNAKPPATPALGFVQWFRPGEHQHVREAADALEAMGVSQLRTHLSWAEYWAAGGEAWYDWLLGTLGQRFDLLPCLHYTPPDLAESGRSSGPPRDLKALADFVDLVINRHGKHFEWLELWNEPNNLLDWDWRLDFDWMKFCKMFGAAAYWAQQRGKRVVLPASCPTDLNWLRLMGERGILDVVNAIGIHGFPDTWESQHAGIWCGWPDVVAQVHAAIKPFNPGAELWVTETGYSTWRHDPARQLTAFTAAMEAPVSRLYWYGLRDLADDVIVQEGSHFDERHYHFGVDRADGRPKLLGRLLRDGGPNAVRDVSVVIGAPAIYKIKPVLITGGAGFIGTNLANRLAAEGEHVLLYDALARPGVEQNLHWLRRQHPARIAFTLGDMRDRAALDQATQGASAVFHLAAQVAVTTSFDDPEDDLQTNIKGTFNLLESLRRHGGTVPVIFASTNKVYGNLEQVGLELQDGAWAPRDARLRKYGLNEDFSLSFATPYGCSKGAADQYVLDYAHSFGMKTCVLRMSCIYGPRQLGTEDQGWVAHFMLRAVQNQPITLFGDGRQVRDILYVTDAVTAYVSAWKRIGEVAGRALNLGGGPENAVSLVQLIGHLEALLGRPVPLRFEDWRRHDQRYFVADSRRAREVLGLPNPTAWREGTAMLLREIGDRYGQVLPGGAQRAATRVTA